MSQSERVLGGRYRVEAEVGRGGMAQVYRGTDTVLGRQVAIKVLAPQFAEDQAFVNRFRREAKAAARLTHPNLVGVYDTGSDDGTHFIVMEYVEGRTLADFLASGGRLLPARAMELTEAVCGALAFAHENGVVHRDIKPGNIMITRAGEVKVMDFGIARATSAETVTQTASVLGTAAYLSPEQAQSAPVDARSDLYSLGVVLYEMLTGRVPFTGDTAVSVAYKHVQETPELPSHLNPELAPELDSVVMRALAKNPANRYQSAGEFRRDLERVRRGEPVEATPLLPGATTQVIRRDAPATQVLPQQPPGRAGGGKRWAIGLGIALILLGLLGGGLWLFANSVLGGATMVTVPKVIGEQEKDALRILQDAGLKVEIGKRRFYELEPGAVIDQQPPANTEVEEGSTVTIDISKGSREFVVPDVVGDPEATAQTEIEDAGLVVGDVTDSTSDTVAAGNVISQDPSAGQDVSGGTAVDLVVSSGLGTTTVPDVICFPFSKAKQTLQAAGLNVTLAGTRPANPACPQPNKVVSQTPAADTEAPAGSTVQVWTSEPQPSPTPTGTSTP